MTRIWAAAAILLNVVHAAAVHKNHSSVAHAHADVAVLNPAYYNSTFPKFFENPHPAAEPPKQKHRFLEAIKFATRTPNFLTGDDEGDHGDTFSSGNWAGINHFYLAPLYAKSPEDLRYTLDKIQAAGFKVVRTFIQQQFYECAKTDEVSRLPDLENMNDGFGFFNGQVMAIYERVFEEIYKRGMKVILPLRNGNNFGASPCDIYCTAAGGKLGQEGNGGVSPYAAKYYSDPTLIRAFDARIDWILDYPMRAFGNKRLGELDELVLAFEPENEPFIQLSDNNPLIDGPWLCDRAKRIKRGTRGSNILVATGSIGGSWEHGNIRESAIKCPEIDVIAIHGYFDRSETNKWEKVLNPAVRRGNEAGKLVLVEEWFSRYPSLDSNGVARKTADMRIQAISMQKAGVPSLYWDAMKKPEGTLCHGSDWASEHDDISVDGPWWGVVANLVSWVGKQAASQPRWQQFLSLPNRLVEATPRIPDDWQTSAQWKERMPVVHFPEPTTKPKPSSTARPTPPEISTSATSNPAPSSRPTAIPPPVPSPVPPPVIFCEPDYPCPRGTVCQDGYCLPPADQVPTPVTKTAGPSPTSAPPKGECDSIHLCPGEQDCVNSKCVQCSWGCATWNCSPSVPCRASNVCINGTCRKK
ncbi:hypothetical protein HDU86_005203 [Geranomyces michiganensis]|nr:hypothetical protein HDU86_005203 [Geranomyces michiganensis]